MLYADNGYSITSDNYSQYALVTESPTQTETLSGPETQALLYALARLCQAGQIASHLKRGIFYNKPEERAAAVSAANFALAGNPPIAELQSYSDIQILNLNADQRRLLHGLLGKIDELNELADAIKGELMGNKPLDGVNVEEEIGDDLWYDAVILDTIQTTFNEVMTRNIRKLKKRYPQGYTDQAAHTRDLAGEREVLASAVSATVQ